MTPVELCRLNGWVATGINDFSCANVGDNGTHNSQLVQFDFLLIWKNSMYCPQLGRCAVNDMTVNHS